MREARLKAVLYIVSSYLSDPVSELYLRGRCSLVFLIIQEKLLEKVKKYWGEKRVKFLKTTSGFCPFRKLLGFLVVCILLTFLPTTLEACTNFSNQIDCLYLIPHFSIFQPLLPLHGQVLLIDRSV